MGLVLHVIPHLLQFKFDARTSRGSMPKHQVYYIKLYDSENKNKVGIGECAPLPGLSPEHHAGFAEELKQHVTEINNYLQLNNLNSLESIINDKQVIKHSSLKFALETAWLDYTNGGNKLIYQNYFSDAKKGIPINGLIWMGNKAFMQEQIKAKLEEGFTCLKLKIGGLEFDTELAILKSIREVASADNLTIRVDANGAFNPDQALTKLDQLATFRIHSIEQPIKPKQPEVMEHLCLHSPVPIALDEELIGVQEINQKEQLLSYIKPQYIILKPTLAGGFSGCTEWIELAEKQNIGWWVTSALESNIGLNAISQFTAQYSIQMPQGLGTGKLYHNNITSPLKIDEGYLYYDKNITWGEI